MKRAFFLCFITCLFCLTGCSKSKQASFERPQGLIQYAYEDSSIVVSLDFEKLKKSPLKSLVEAGQAPFKGSSDFHDAESTPKALSIFIAPPQFFKVGPFEHQEQVSEQKADVSFSLFEIKDAKALLSKQEDRGTVTKETLKDGKAIVKREKDEIHGDYDDAIYADDRFLLWAEGFQIDRAIAQLEKGNTLHQKYPELVKNIEDSMASVTLFYPSNENPTENWVWLKEKLAPTFKTLDQVKQAQAFIQMVGEDVKFNLSVFLNNEANTKVFADEIKAAIEAISADPALAVFKPFFGKIELKQINARIDATLILDKAFFSTLDAFFNFKVVPTENKDNGSENKDNGSENKDNDTENKDNDTENKDNDTENKDNDTENKDNGSEPLP